MQSYKIIGLPIRLVIFQRCSTLIQNLSAQPVPQMSKRGSSLFTVSAPVLQVKVKVIDHGPSFRMTVHIMTGQPLLNNCSTFFNLFRSVRLQFSPGDLQRSFAVHFFFGDPTTNNVMQDDAYVGSAFSFTMPMAGDLIIQSFVHLSKAMLKHGLFMPLAPVLITPYLSSKLSWTITEVCRPRPDHMRGSGADENVGRFNYNDRPFPTSITGNSSHVRLSVSCCLADEYANTCKAVYICKHNSG